VFEVGSDTIVHVEQHRSLTDHVYQMGEKETICWPADAGVLLETVIGAADYAESE
tara:strand:- start:796 stop:960 length:165 start_codon:yes stop_codon:yes gene_type:complete